MLGKAFKDLVGFVGVVGKEIKGSNKGEDVRQDASATNMSAQFPRHSRQTLPGSRFHPAVTTARLLHSVV